MFFLVFGDEGIGGYDVVDEFGNLGGSVGVLFDGFSVCLHVDCRINFVKPFIFLFYFLDERWCGDCVSDAGGMLGGDGLIIYFQLDADVGELWDFGAVFVGVFVLISTSVTIGVHVIFGSDGKFGVWSFVVLVGFDVVDGRADLDGCERLTYFVEYVPVGGEGGAGCCGHDEFFFEGLRKPHRTEDVLALEILVEEPSGGADNAFVIDYDVESSDGRLIEIFEEAVEKSEVLSFEDATATKGILID